MTLLRIAAVLGALILLVGGLAAVGAGSATDAEYDDEVRIVDEHIVVKDGVITISDTTLRGPGLPDKHVEDSRYALETTIRFDGIHIVHDNTLYTICRVVIDVEGIGVHFKNVTLSSGG